MWLFILVLCVKSGALQQVFETSETCEFPNKSSFYLNSKTWQVTGTFKQTKDKLFLISPCGVVPSEYRCKQGAAACIINKKDPAKSILNAGYFFVQDYDAESESNILRSYGGQPCNPKENFTVIIQFNCQPNTKENPRLLNEDDCELRVEMLSPDCCPTCTTRTNGNLIDLRELKKQGTFRVPHGESSFAVTFCTMSDACDKDVSVCENTKIGSVPILDKNTISVTYKEVQGWKVLVLKGHHGDTKRSRKDAEIYLRCNWNEPGITGLKYLQPKVQGRMFKFEGESSLACIKMPMDCLVVDPNDSYFVYDLNSLKKSGSSWKITGNSGTIQLNICGPLKLQSGNVCTKQSSQVCLVNNKGEYHNLGTVTSNIHITQNDTVLATFTEGSACLVNSSLSYRTEIEFACSSKEFGPVLESDVNCTYRIGWKTPAACPKNVAREGDCLMSDLLGNIDLNRIHQPLDVKHDLTHNSFLRYNLCGILNTPCNGRNNTSVCYVKDGTEYVAGFERNILLRKNTLLSLNLIGEKCDLRLRRATNVYFTCDLAAPITGNIQVKLLSGDCVFEIRVSTPLACARPITSRCILYTKDSAYDLTNLMHNSSSYKVQDQTDPGTVYFLNVCKSVINKNDLFCPVNSGACAKNLNEPHLKHMYKSIGRIREQTKLIFENGILSIIYNSGDLCKAEYVHYSTTIQFACSNKEEGPKLLSKTACSYTFLWRTPNACLKLVFALKKRRHSIECTNKSPIPNASDLDFVRVDKNLELKIGSVLYTFNICEQNYSCYNLTADLDCGSHSKMDFVSTNQTINVRYTLNHSCIEYEMPNVILIKLVCDRSHAIEKLEYISDNNCTKYMQFTSSVVCPKQVELVRYKTNIESGNTESTTVAIEFRSLSTRQPSNCSVQINNGAFDLKNLDFEVNTSNGNKYSVAFGNDSSSCPSYVCLNGAKFIEMTSECPRNVGETTVEFNSSKPCQNDSAILEIRLKCKVKPDELPTVEENPCKIVITYPDLDICMLIAQSNNGVILSVSLAIIVFVILIIIIICARRYRKRVTSSTLGNLHIAINKRSTAVYYKDLSL